MNSQRQISIIEYENSRIGFGFSIYASPLLDGNVVHHNALRNSSLRLDSRVSSNVAVLERCFLLDTSVMIHVAVLHLRAFYNCCRRDARYRR